MKLVARLTISHPRSIVALWMLIAIVAVLPATQLGKRIGNGGYEVPGSQTEQVNKLVQSNFPSAAGQPLAAIFTSSKPDERRLQERAHRLALALSRRPRTHLLLGGSYAGPSHKMVVVPFAVRESLADAQKNITSLRDWIQSSAGGDVTLTGQAAIWRESTDIAKKDLQRAERISVPVSLIVLVVAFLSVIAALLPIGLALVGLIATFAVLGLLSHLVGMTVYVTNTAQILGLGLAIDYSLFTVARYREHRNEGLDTNDAIMGAVTTTGRAVLVSGITIALGLASLTVLGIQIFSSMAFGASAAAAIAALAAITLLPAVLKIVGPGIDRLSLKPAVVAASRGRLWRSLSEGILRRRWAVLLVSTLFLLACATPLLGSRLVFAGADALLPTNNHLRHINDAITHEFGGDFVEPVEIMTRPDHAQVIGQTIVHYPAVASVLPPEPGRQGWSRIYVILKVSGGSRVADSAVRQIRAAVNRIGGGRAFVGGEPALGVDLIDHVKARFIWMVLVSCLLAFVLLLVALRSVVVSLKAVATNLLSVAATVGLVNLIFTDIGNAQGLAWFVTPFLFAVVFGLSMDYEIFLLSRVREEYDRRHDNDEAVSHALQRSGRSITLAALVMMLVFLSSSFTTLESFRQLGVGMAIAVLLDATVVRCALVPAALAVLGDRNWWLPRFLAGRRRSPAWVDG